MKHIMVTGAAGFIGWYTAKMLLAEGVNVVGVDEINDYYDVRLKEFRLKDLHKYDNFTFHKCDIADPAAMRPLFEKYNIEAVINLAARPGVRYSIENPYAYLHSNTLGTLSLLEAMKDFGVKKMVLSSTSSLYAGQKIPFNEELPVNTPISPYAATKKAAEVMAYTYHHLYNLDITVLRYFTVYGPAGRPDMSVLRFIKWINDGTPLTLYGDGTQTRDFTYIEDIAAGTVKGLKNLGYEIVNLGGGREPVSINYLISLIEKSLGKKAVIDYKPFHAADMTETGADISKAERLLGWQPYTDLEEGVERSVRWYLDNISWTKDLKL
jgi:nucleoside-diphosphate-sugar epimerase